MNALLVRGSPASVADVSARDVTVVASTDERDRYGDRISVDGTLDHKALKHASGRRAEGWNTKDFERNPVVLIGHDTHSLPVGKVVKLWRSESGNAKRVSATMRFSRANPMADTALALYKDGSLSAVSVGFLPEEPPIVPKSLAERAAWRLGPHGVIHGTQMLYELSCVAIPANPSATVQTDGLRALASAAARSGHAMVARSIRAALAPDPRVLIDEMAGRLCAALSRTLSGHDREETARVRATIRHVFAEETAKLRRGMRR